MYSFIIYAGTFLVSALFAECYRQAEIKRRSQKNHIFQKIAGIFLIVALPVYVASIRKNIGADYKQYSMMFELANSGSFANYYLYFPGTEIGNYFLMKLGYAINGDIQTIFALYAILTITIFTIDLAYYKDRFPLFWSFIIFYVLYYSAIFNTIRQMLAVSIALFGLRYIEKRKFFPFIITVLIAMLFHSTAFVMIIFYFLVNRRNVSSKLLSKLATILLALLPIVVLGIYKFGSGLPIVGKYFELYQLKVNGAFVVDLVFRIFLYGTWIRNLHLQKDDNNKIYYYMLLADFEFILLSFFFTWAYRFTYYTSFAQIIIIGTRIQHSLSLNTKMSKAIFYTCLYLIFFAMLVILWERDKITPYTTIFSQL